MTEDKKLLKEERETYLNISDDGTHWLAETSIPKDMRKFQKQGWTKIGETLYSDGTPMSMQFTAPRKYISIRAITSGRGGSGRKMSEEHKQKLLAARQKAAKR